MSTADAAGTAAPPLDLDRINDELAQAPAEDIVRWAVRTFGAGLVLSSSFGAESATMLHLVTRVAPDIPVVVVDTGYLFPETYRFMQELTERLKLNLCVFQSPISPARMEAVRGRLWEQGAKGLEQYNHLRKVEPMDRALRELRASAWLAGLRADQTRFRATLRVVERQGAIHKVHPILRWTTREVHAYLKRHDLPYHPLYEQGYQSIGDVHTTRPITAGQDPREGRFGGLKQECGLHLPSTPAENQSRESSDL